MTVDVLSFTALYKHTIYVILTIMNVVELSFKYLFHLLLVLVNGVRDKLLPRYPSERAQKMTGNSQQAAADRPEIDFDVTLLVT